MPDEVIRAHAFVSGRVQGVGYRAFAHRLAREAGLRGTVRNLPDARVEVEVEGPRDAVQALLAQLKQGPRLARVDDVAVQWEQPIGRETDFRIR